jgi:hypothetical protein
VVITQVVRMACRDFRINRAEWYSPKH